MKRNRRLGTINYGWLLLIGFGFLAVSLAGTVIDLNLRNLQWRVFGNQSIYQNSLPTAIGRIIGIIFPLLFGLLSDRASGRRGRRLPFILAGLSVGAILLFLIPLGASQYFLLLGVLAAFSLAMTAWQTPAVALMMDGTPSHLRSKANGILGLMGGVGTIAAYLATYRFNPQCPGQRLHAEYPAGLRFLCRNGGGGMGFLPLLCSGTQAPGRRGGGGDPRP
jgi:MFS family permease